VQIPDDPPKKRFVEIASRGALKKSAEDDRYVDNRRLPLFWSFQNEKGIVPATTRSHDRDDPSVRGTASRQLDPADTRGWSSALNRPILLSRTPHYPN
jgi:hypothetical protein